MGSEQRSQEMGLARKVLPAACRRDKLIRRSPGPEIVSQLIEGAAEALRRSKAFKAEHRIVALFNAAMILFNGLITNDKFCLSLVSSQKLGWVRGPRVGVGGRTDPANHPEGVR